MLRCEPYDWSDVTPPTDAELAEVDAAIEAAPKVPDTILPLRSYAVREAYLAVGPSNGTTKWFLQFAAHCLALTDTVGELLRGIDVDRMLELACRWHNALGRQQYLRRHDMPVWILEEMVHHLPMEVVARYLDTTPAQIDRWLFPLSDLDALRAAVTAWQEGQALYLAADAAGVWKANVESYIRAWRLPIPVVTTVDGRRVMPPEVAARIRQLGNVGMKAAAVLAQVKEEFPESTVTLQRSAVNQMLYRLRAAA